MIIEIVSDLKNKTSEHNVSAIKFFLSFFFVFYYIFS